MSYLWRFDGSAIQRRRRRFQTRVDEDRLTKQWLTLKSAELNPRCSVVSSRLDAWLTRSIWSVNWETRINEAARRTAFRSAPLRLRVPTTRVFISDFFHRQYVASILIKRRGSRWDYPPLFFPPFTPHSSFHRATKAAFYVWVLSIGQGYLWSLFKAIITLHTGRRKYSNCGSSER